MACFTFMSHSVCAFRSRNIATAINLRLAGTGSAHPTLFSSLRRRRRHLRVSKMHKVVQQELCDTLPAAKIAVPDISTRRSPSPSVSFDISLDESDKTADNVTPSVRKLCVRHQRMADGEMSLKLQQSLDALPFEEREAVNAIWTNFSSSSHPRRNLILQGLLTMCCFSQLSLLSTQLSDLIRVDPLSVLPRELTLKIFTYLDATSLCRAAQVSQQWRRIADDDILWRGICQQHIGQKCLKCGWGLPVLDRRRATRSPRLDSDMQDSGERSPKRRRADESGQHHAAVRPPHFPHADSEAGTSSKRRRDSLLVAEAQESSVVSATRPWKEVYSERLTIEKNWRGGKAQKRVLKGHTNGVMCLQFSESLPHPSFPILISGSYDCTARVWNLDTGEELACLKGHTSTIRALQFDEAKLITGSMDHTMRVWNWRTGKCIKTLTGHTDGVVCLHFDQDVLASGSVDTTIKIWLLKTGAAFTLRGHADWVNSVQLWDSQTDADLSTRRGSEDDLLSIGSQSSSSYIRPGKMLFSASDDGTIRLWDLGLRTCTKVFGGHVAQVQSMRLLLLDEDCDGASPARSSDSASSKSVAAVTRKPVLVSGSLDNTIKLWDIDTGKSVRTLFGHLEGVWGVASDRLRLVSGSHDKTIKVWSREDGSCTSTLVGHRGAVNCVALGEDKIVSGSDDGDIRIWAFTG